MLVLQKPKEKYYTKLSSRLVDPLTGPKTYWSILKTFLSIKNIPCIPPVFHENIFITVIKEKAGLFNHFFVNQCSLFSNNSVLSKCLISIYFSSSDIAKIISNLNPNKAHCLDMLSIQMIKLCGNSIFKPLSIIFNDCVNECKFPHEWKKLTLYLYIRKETNSVWKTIGQSLYSLFLVKFLNVSFITKCFTFFSENNLISPNQWGFRRGDSCVNQWPAINHEIYKSFNEGFEVRGVFIESSRYIWSFRWGMTRRFTSQIKSKWYF